MNTMNNVSRTPRTHNALSVGTLMSRISDLNSFCFVEPARRVLDEALRQLEEIRLDAQWKEREEEMLDEEEAA